MLQLKQIYVSCPHYSTDISFNILIPCIANSTELVCNTTWNTEIQSFIFVLCTGNSVFAHISWTMHAVLLSPVVP